MPGDFGFQFVPKQFFFDRAAVLEKVAKGQRQAQSRIGAFVRTRARSLTNKSSKSPRTAPAGSPPKKHRGDLRNLIYFAYDPGTGSVVVGPVRFGAGAAEVLEHGGTEVLVDRRGHRKTAHYAGNPFMQPSLQAEIDAG